MDDIVSVTARGIDRTLREGLALFDEGRYEDALKIFEGALAHFGPNMDLYHWKGVTLRHLGRLREAVEALEQSAAAPKPAGSLYELAALLVEEGVDAERGVGILEELSGQGDLPAREYLAHRAYEEGNFPSVLELTRAERSPEMETQWPDAVECLETLEGIALTETGRLEEARFHLKRVARKSPGCASHMTNLGRIYQLEGRHPRALKSYLRAVELDPDDPVPQINLAHLYDEMGRKDAARNVFQTLYDEFGDDPSVLEEFARFLSRNGDGPRAFRIVEQALTTAADGPERDDLAAFLGWLAMDSGDHPRAIAMWEGLITERPEAFAARHYLAGLMAETGEATRALNLLEDAHRIDPAAARNWCVRPDGQVEACFRRIALEPRFRVVAGLPAEPGATP
ncbi:MAG: tetratricopeptide repeat protein [Nitrospirota bacterium]|nr:tetratricopeptide repeat protein [Nitrospirota bacterium]